MTTNTIDSPTQSQAEPAVEPPATKQATPANEPSGSSTESEQTAGTQLDARDTVNTFLDDLGAVLPDSSGPVSSPTAQQAQQLSASTNSPVDSTPDSRELALIPPPAAKELADPQRAKAEKVDTARDWILKGDQTLGKPDGKGGRGIINTPVEEKLLNKWLSGDGTPYTLTSDEWSTARNDDAVQSIGKRIQEGDTGENKAAKPPKQRIEQVDLSDGTRGWRAVVSLDKNDQLDGSIGKATLYFNRQGEPVGLRDVYNFGNSGISVDLVNMAGAYAGAKGFNVQAGTTEKTSPNSEEADAPNGLHAAGSLVGKGVGWIFEKFGEGVGEARKSGVNPLAPY